VDGATGSAGGASAALADALAAAKILSATPATKARVIAISLAANPVAELPSANAEQIASDT